MVWWYCYWVYLSWSTFSYISYKCSTNLETALWGNTSWSHLAHCINNSACHTETGTHAGPSTYFRSVVPSLRSSDVSPLFQRFTGSVSPTHCLVWALVVNYELIHSVDIWRSWWGWLRCWQWVGIDPILLSWQDYALNWKGKGQKDTFVTVVFNYPWLVIAS